MAEFDNPLLEGDLDDASTATIALTQREKRDKQKSILRPLANRRPELYGALTEPHA